MCLRLRDCLLLAAVLAAAPAVAGAQDVDDLIFFEGNGCSQDIVFTYNSHVDASDNCQKRGACKGDNDEARSVQIAKSVKAGSRFVVFDDPSGKQDDDHTVVSIVDKDFLQPEGYCLRTFENSFDNPDSNSGIKVEHVRKNGLDGKVSHVRVTANAPILTSGGSGSLSSGGASLVAAHSGQCLDVANASGEPGAPIGQWPCHGGGNQHWSLQGSSLVAAHSGQCMDVAGASVEPGAPVGQWPCHGGSNQTWALHPIGGGAFTVTSAASGLCLDVAGGGPGVGARLVQWPCHGRPNQTWSKR